MEAMQQNPYRVEYRTLNADETRLVNEIKEKAFELFKKMNTGDPRLQAIAKTHLETSVMFAVKAITG